MSSEERVVQAATERLEAFPGLALDVADDGTIVAANARARELLGISSSRAFTELIDPNSIAKWQRALLGAGPVESVELHLRTTHGVAPHGLFVSGSMNGSRIVIELPRDPDVERLQEAAYALNSELVNAQRQISKQRADLERTSAQLKKSLETEMRLSLDLQAHNEEMEAQNEELLSLTEELREQQDAWRTLNERLEAQATELKRVMSARERFYSAMSHELRTPLTAVLGYTHLLLDDIAGEMSSQQRGFIERTHTAALHLKSLIDDVLDLAKLESGTLELELEQTLVRPLAAELIDTVQPLAREHGSALDLDIDDAPEFLTTDARALRQIVLNLLSNALKFGASRPVRLHITRHGDDVVFEVIDRGIGIPPDQLQHVFEEFVQLDPAQHPGTGLGLSISRQLAERLGGRLEAESEPGTGSTFRLTLPLTGPEEA